MRRPTRWGSSTMRITSSGSRPAAANCAGHKASLYKEMEDEDDSLLVVAETYCRYKSPAFYEDVLTIRTKVGEIRSRSIRFIYEVIRASDGTSACRGRNAASRHRPEQKGPSLPEVYKQSLLTEPQPEQAFPANQAPQLRSSQSRIPAARDRFDPAAEHDLVCQLESASAGLKLDVCPVRVEPKFTLSPR